MSEKIFAYLLRLYPAHFRKAYGEEALLLLHDRARDEQGFLLRCGLWVDLLADLAVSIPREYRNNPQTILGASARPCWNGIPSFQMLEGEAPTLSSLLFGGVLSLVIYASILFLIGHGSSHFPLPDANTLQRPSYALSPTPARPRGESNQSSGDDQAASRENNSPRSGQARATAAKKQFKEFDVASIRESKTNDPPSTESRTSDPTSPDLSLGPSDMYVRNGGYFHMTNLPLFGYITFAYKLNRYQSAALQRQVPDWVKLTKYDIEARVQGDPDKEDMRIMMRALLADRFKLKMHSEAQHVPVLNMVPPEQGETGPALKLVPDKGPVEIYMLDHVERPSEN
jgi:Protein of unknown function (DUF3738)